MFDASVIEDIKQHAISCFPEESCGFVIDGVYVPKQNIAENPRDHFLIDPREWPLDKKPQAMIHSHPNGALQPSKADMQAQIDMAIPCGIVRVYRVENNIMATNVLFWGSGVETPALIGRTFRHGPSGSDGGGDCYALIKDFYKLELGIDLPDFPRSHNWWETGESMYVENFEKAGFERISESELQYGDVFLAQIRSKVPNHGGIYLGKGVALQHFQDRLSRRDPITPWRKFITHFLRYTKNKES